MNEDQDRVSITYQHDGTARVWLPDVAYLDTQAGPVELGLDQELLVELYDRLGVYLAGDHQAEHVYLSTGCLHGEHGYCQSNTGAAGTKVPAECKFCQAPCVCPCHKAGGER